jgi:hypothetical protein
MSSFEGAAPTIQLDSVGIGFQLNSDGNAVNVESLDLNVNEYLVVGEKTYFPNEPNSHNTKWNFLVNSGGVAINTSRNLSSNFLTTDTSLYVDNNIHCAGIIKASGLELNNIKIDGDPLTSSLIRDFIASANNISVNQPFQTGLTCNIFNINNEEYDVKNIFTPNFVTFGGYVDTYKNTHPLNIVSSANNNFNSMHLSIRNDVNNEEEPSKLCIGIIGGSNISPAVISTTKGMPLEFHVSQSSNIINNLYGSSSLPIYEDISHLPAMTIDANNNVGIGTNKTTVRIFNRKIFNNGIITQEDILNEPTRFEVNGISTLKEIILYDYYTKTYKNIDDIYIRSSGFSVINATQIRGGNFLDLNYKFANNLEVNNLLETNNINIVNNANVGNILESKALIVKEASIFQGDVEFGNNVNFTNTEKISINNLEINNDIFISGKRVTPIDINDPYTGYGTRTVSEDGSNFFFTYVHSNIANLDANCNISFPKKMAVGMTSSDGFDGILNIIKDDNSTSNNFDIFLKNKVEANEYITNIGRLSRLDYSDNSFIINTNKVNGKKNNIYFYPSSDISELTSNYYFPNIKNTPPTLSINKGKVGINILNPRNGYSLDVLGNIAATDYYLSINNESHRIKNFIYNEKNYFNIFDSITDKFCINYNNITSYAIGMKGFNVKKGMNADLYYQNDKIIETLQIANNTKSFYTNKKIAIGWNGENVVAPLQIRNMTTEDNNYSVIRIYRGLRGGGANNNADYSGIDICEYDRHLDNERNNEKWFIYKNHKYNDLDSRNISRVGPLQIGYTDKTFKPQSYGMSFYYNTQNSNYHIDVNNPNVSYDYNSKSAMSIYGDLEVHGNINIIDDYGKNYKFRLADLSTLSEVKTYINTIQSSQESYDEDNIVSLNFSLLTPNSSLVIDPLDDLSIPLIIKQDNSNFSVAKFITFSDENIISTSSIELGIYNSNLSIFDDNIDKTENMRNMVELKVSSFDNDTSFKMSFYNNNTKNYNSFINFKNNINEVGEVTNIYTHLGTGINTNNSNITLHIDDNNKYGLQITNNQKPSAINLLQSGGDKNIYHTISGGDFNNSHKLSISISNDSSNNEIISESNVFIIDGFHENGNIRNGARFGFNEYNPIESFVIKSEYDTPSVSITSRYTKEHIYDSIININKSNININKISSNWDNTNNKYKSVYKYNTNILDDIDSNSNVISNENKNNSEFIFNTSVLSTKTLNYDTIHSNLNINYNSSNLSVINNNYNITNFISTLNNGIYNISQDYYPSNCNINITPNLSYTNNLVIPDDLSVEIFNFQTNFNFQLNNIDNIVSNYNFINNYSNIYLLPKNINCNITINHDTDAIKSNDSNIITINNIIYTDLYTDNFAFDNTEINIPQVVNIYIKTQKLDDNGIYSNIHLNTNTCNITRYNSNLNIDGKFITYRSNKIDFETSNILPDSFINQEYDNILDLSYDISVINNKSNINIKTSNFVINPNINTIPRDMFFSNINPNMNFIDEFYIYDNMFSNIIILDEYYNILSNSQENDFIINIKNYNYKNFKPHITLINDITTLDNFSGHEIYSYDGIFELKYINSITSENYIPFTIDKSGNATIKGGFDMGGDLIIDGNIYDAYGNNLIEILNKNYYKEYEINSSNINFNSLGENGIEINSYSSSNHENYKFIYVKDYFDNNVVTDVMKLHKNNINSLYKIDLYGDIDTSNGILRVEGRDIINDTCNYIVSTSNILFNKSSNFDFDTSNYIARTSNVISTTLNSNIKDTCNYILSTSNLLFNKNSNFDFNTSNYIFRTSNVISTTLNSNIKDTCNYIVSTSNILFNKNSNFDFNTSNYIARTSNVISTTLNSNIKDTCNYIVSTSNILFNKNSNFDFNTSNYIFRTSNVISTTLNNELENTREYIDYTSNILFNKNSNFDFNTSNYIARTSNVISTTLNTNLNNTSNILFNKNSNFDFNTSNYIAITSNVISTTLNNNLNNTSNILFNKNSNFDFNTSNYIARTSNVISTTLNSNIKDTCNYIVYTSNLLFNKSSNFDFDSSNYIDRTSNVLTNNLKNTNLETSNIISTRITNLNTDMIIEDIDAHKKFIIDNNYNDNLNIIGNLHITQNLTVQGETTTFNTDVYTTEQLEVVNNGIGTAFVLTQTGVIYDIFNASNSIGEVFTILNNGNVGIGVTNPDNNNKLSVNGNINIISTGGNIYKYTIDGRDIIQETCNYIVSTSNILFNKSSNFDFNTSNHIRTTSNILFNKNSNFDFNTSNYIARTSNVISTTINTDLNNTSNILFNKNSNFDFNTSNYIFRTSNVISTTLNNNIKDTCNYIVSTSNLLFNKNSNFDFNTSNYISRTSNVISTTLNTNLNNNSNILFNKNSNFDFNTSNYIARTSNVISTTLNSNIKDTCNYIVSTSNILFNKNSNLDFNTSNYIVRTSNVLTNNLKNINLETSNVISTRITSLNTDNISEIITSTNKFIIDNNYDNSLNLNSNLKIYNNGDYSSLDITHNGLGNIINISNISSQVFTILNDGKVGIGVTDPGGVNNDIKLNVNGNINISGNYMRYGEIFKTSQWTTNDEMIYFNVSNIGIGTSNPSGLLSLYGNNATMKIQDGRESIESTTSIELINGENSFIDGSDIICGWRMTNSNNQYILQSGSNNLITNRFSIDGLSGNVGIGTHPHIYDNSVDIDEFKLNIQGSLNIVGDIYKDGELFSGGGGGGGGGSVGVISQNMSVQTLSNTYNKTVKMSDNDIIQTTTDGWRFIDNNITSGFVIKIKPSHRTSKILLNISCHIGFDSSKDSRWWGLRLYRKKGVFGNWLEVTEANGDTTNEGTVTGCWTSHNLGANLSTYDNFVANVSTSFFDSPDSRIDVYYTVKWKSRLGVNNNTNDSGGDLYLNRPATYNDGNSPILVSTWTAQEIWQLGTPFIPSEGSNIITIYNQDFVGIGNTEPQTALDIVGDFRIDGNIIPVLSNSSNLGSPSNRWKDLYLSGDSIFLDNVVISKNIDSNLDIKDTNGNFKNININTIELNNGGNKLSLSLNNDGNITYIKTPQNGIEEILFPAVSIDQNESVNTITSNVLNVYLENTTNDILEETSNYNIITSNIISNRIKNLTSDNIEEGSINKFIVNGLYNGPVNINGTLTVNDLIIPGTISTLNTDIYITEKLEIINESSLTALSIKQNNISGDIFNISNSTSEVFTILNNGNVGIGTNNPFSILSLYGNNSTLKIHDGRINSDSVSSIELINGLNSSIGGNDSKCGWRISNSNNKYILTSGSNNIINDRFVIDGLSGNVGVNNIEPNYNLDINGSVNASSFNINGSPFVLEFSQGMTIQTKHNTYTSTESKVENSIGWIPINNDINTGFVINIKPSHISSKIIVSIVCHIGMDYDQDSRWWGLQLYRKIGSGNWEKITGANGNDISVSGSACWISHNLGAESSTYSHFITNVCGSYEDTPNTTEEVYYTAYWKSRLDDTSGSLYLNKSAELNPNSNYPKPSSSWTATEIWNNGTPYYPQQTTITIAHNKVGIGITPTIDSIHKLNVSGKIICEAVNLISDIRYKKNIVKIDSVLDLVNKINPVSYLLLDKCEIKDKKSYGFIAQEIEKIFPNVVNVPLKETDNYSIDYSSIIPLLTKSIQELSEKINNQQQEIIELKHRLS